MLGALIAVVVCVSWVMYVAMSVITITSGVTTHIVVWAVATPLVLALEALGIKSLDHVVKFG